MYTETGWRKKNSWKTEKSIRRAKQSDEDFPRWLQMVEFVVFAAMRWKLNPRIRWVARINRTETKWEVWWGVGGRDRVWWWLMSFPADLFLTFTRKSFTKQILPTAKMFVWRTRWLDEERGETTRLCIRRTQLPTRPSFANLKFALT